MSERYRESPAQIELSKSDEAFDELFSLVDGNSSEEEIQNRVMDIIRSLWEVRDWNTIKRFLNSKWDETNRDWRFVDASKRLKLKQIILQVESNFTQASQINSPQVNQINLMRNIDRGPSAVKLQVTWWKIKLYKTTYNLKQVSDQTSTIIKWWAADVNLKFVEDTWRFAKLSNTKTVSFIFNEQSGFVEVFLKDQSTNSVQILETIVLRKWIRNHCAKIKLPDWEFTVNMDW